MKTLTLKMALTQAKQKYMQLELGLYLNVLLVNNV